MAISAYHQPHYPWARIRELAEQGCSFTDLAIQFGCARSGIAFRAKKEAWRVADGRFAQKLVAREEGRLVLKRSPRSILALFRGAEQGTRANLATFVLKLSRELNSLPKDKLLEHTKQLKDVAITANLIFGWNDPKPGNESALLKSELFSLTPDQLAKLAATEIEARPIEPVVTGCNVQELP